MIWIVARRRRRGGDDRRRRAASGSASGSQPRRQPDLRAVGVRHVGLLGHADRLAGRRRRRHPRHEPARADPGPPVARLRPRARTEDPAAGEADAGRHADPDQVGGRRCAGGRPPRPWQVLMTLGASAPAHARPSAARRRRRLQGPAGDDPRVRRRQRMAGRRRPRRAARLRPDPLDRVQALGRPRQGARVRERLRAGLRGRHVLQPARGDPGAARPARALHAAQRGVRARRRAGAQPVEAGALVTVVRVLAAQYGGKSAYQSPSRRNAVQNARLAVSSSSASSMFGT